MGKNRQNITRDFLGNGRRVQLVLNAPQYLHVAYLSPKGKRLLANCEDEALAIEIADKYTKHRKYRNPACTHVVKVITHATA